jgi:hypothetical protein
MSTLRRRSKPDGERDLANVSRWLARIGAAFKGPMNSSSRPKPVASDIATETRAESGATTSPVPVPYTTAIPANAKNAPNGHVSRVAPISSDQREIQRRRELVRTLFNDFWSDRDDKPAAFVERLDQAETYLNERLTASGEFWQLDGKTRELLGLPVRQNSRDQGNGSVQKI